MGMYYIGILICLSSLLRTSYWLRASGVASGKFLPLLLVNQHIRQRFKSLGIISIPHELPHQRCRGITRLRIGDFSLVIVGCATSSTRGELWGILRKSQVTLPKRAKLNSVSNSLRMQSLSRQRRFPWRIPPLFVHIYWTIVLCTTEPHCKYLGPQTVR